MKILESNIKLQKIEDFNKDYENELNRINKDLKDFLGNINKDFDCDSNVLTKNTLFSRITQQGK